MLDSIMTNDMHDVELNYDVACSSRLNKLVVAKVSRAVFSAFWGGFFDFRFRITGLQTVIL